MEIKIEDFGPTVVFLVKEIYARTSGETDITNEYLLAEALEVSFKERLREGREAEPIESFDVDVLCYREFTPEDWTHATQPIAFDLVCCPSLAKRTVRILRSDFTQSRAHRVYFSMDIIQKLTDSEQVIVHNRKGIVDVLWDIVQAHTARKA